MTTMLDPVRHERLLMDLDGVCNRAGIAHRFIHESASKTCGEAETSWLKEYRAHPNPGLKLVGPSGVDRCMAMAAALLRNYIDARVRTVEEIVDNPPDCSVLLCPNFYTATSIKGMPAWRIQKLYDIMVARYKNDQPTIVWVESEQGLSAYGSAMVDLLSNFKVSKSF